MKQALLSLGLLIAASPAFADGPARVEILPGWRTAEGSHMAALRVSLDPGWKTYWRAPGEAGIPPSFDWTGSENLGEVRFHWPVPEVFDAGGTTTIGYHDVLILPMEVIPADPARAVHIEAGVELGVCENICMPMSAHVTAELAQDGAQDDALIMAALAHQPETAEAAGVVSAQCRVAPISDGVRVTATVELPELGAAEVAVIEPEDPQIWASGAMVSRVGGVLEVVSDLVPPSAAPFVLDPQTLRLTVLAEGRAVDIRGCSPQG